MSLPHVRWAPPPGFPLASVAVGVQGGTTRLTETHGRCGLGRQLPGNGRWRRVDGNARGGDREVDDEGGARRRAAILGEVPEGLTRPGHTRAERVDSGLLRARELARGQARESRLEKAAERPVAAVRAGP